MTTSRGSGEQGAPVRIALLGAGRIGALHAGNLRADPDALVVGVADPDLAAAERLAGVLGTGAWPRWQDLVRREDLDAVMICSASSAHAEQVVAAAAAGHHVFCEKPLAPDLQGVDAAIGAAERAGVVLHVGFNRRFDPAFGELAETVASGGVGHLLQLRITSRDPDPPPVGYPRGPGGLFSDMAIHDFDTARFVSGEEVVAVSASGSSLVDPLAAEAGDVDVATITLRFASGAIGVIECCRLSTYGYDQRVEVHGTEATAWSTNPLPSVNVLADGRGAVTAPLYRFFPERYESAYPAELRAFLRACRGETGAVAPGGRDARCALVLALTAQRSLAEGRTVAVDEIASASAALAGATYAAAPGTGASSPRIRIGNAPTSWGIEKPSDPSYPSWSRVLDEVAEAGYEGVELGPLGFFPTDPSTLRSELARRHLALSAGVVMEVLHDPETADGVVQKARDICALLEPLGAGRLVVIAGWTPARAKTAGRPAAAQRLDETAWRRLIDTTRRVAEVASGTGMVTAFHPHAGTDVEFADEIERLLGDTDPARVSLCVDTGHSLYAGVDPVGILTDHADRIAHVHFKDVDPAVLDRIEKEELSFWDAYRQGIFCPLGRGAVDFEQVAATLERIGYEGWGTVEQDASPTGESVPLDDARASLAHLRSVGLAR